MGNLKYGGLSFSVGNFSASYHIDKFFEFYFFGQNKLVLVGVGFSEGKSESRIHINYLVGISGGRIKGSETYEFFGSNSKLLFKLAFSAL